jgi:hypothetical protein
MIETQPARTNVPNHNVTVAEALAVLRLAITKQGDARWIRRALLEVLASLEEHE